MSTAYNIKDIISHARSPISYTSDGKTRKKEANENEALSTILDSVFSRIERLNDHNAQFVHLQSLKHKGHAFFGKPVGDAIQELISAHADIDMAVAIKMEDLKRGRQTDKLFEKKLYFTGGDDDEINKKVDNGVRTLEGVCFPELNKPRRWFGLFQ